MAKYQVWYLLIILFLFVFCFPLSLSQSLEKTKDGCNGIFLSYEFVGRERIHPIVADPEKQAYSFQSKATILNTGVEDLKSWMFFVGFQHREILVSVSNAVLSDGSSFPANVSNGTTFSGYPTTDLKTAIETAGNLEKIQVIISILGTQFGVSNKSMPLPSNISLENDGYKCPSNAFNQTERALFVCCQKDPNYKPNITIGDTFQDRQDGDLTINYDVLQSYETNYMAQVTIENHNLLGRLDNWNLTWEWKRQEFIYSMKGAYPTISDANECVYGLQGAFYQKFDFAKVLNCQRNPSILDLPPTKINDTNIGLIPFCCRNGTILPTLMDPSQSKSVFQLQVYKMPPDLNRTVLFPPQNWKISGRLNPNYQCGQPIRVSPSQFPDPSGLESVTSAISSWQIVCNITKQKESKPRCCVSFSAFYNDSVVPCKTCACGCPSSTASTCSTTSTSLLLPSEALLVPFENRTEKTIAWANLKHFNLPKPLPCGDYCGVSINWHLYTDYSGGWTARMTLFNWEDRNFPDWFAAVQLDKAFAGYEKTYSFNGTALTNMNNTIFIQGLKGLNYLMGESNGTDPLKDPRKPGTQQSVISFKKKETPGIKVTAGDGFPTKVFFNGEECSLPSILPTSWASVTSAPRHIFSWLSFLLVFLVLV